MPHQDQVLPNESVLQHQDLKIVFDWLLQHVDFTTLRFDCRCSWTPRALIATALLWAWSPMPNLIDRFGQARTIAIATFGLGAGTAATYQAFLKLLRAWTTRLVAAVVLALRQRMREDLADRFHVGPFAVFGVDGSRLELPRTASNQDHFAPKPKPKPSARSKRRGGRTATPKTAAQQAAAAKKASSPQLWLTTMFHVGTGLPWDWRFGPSGSSEREHLTQMIDTLPADALITADAGFVGYATWKAVLDSQRHLLVRVGSNVRLLKDLGFARERNGLVDLWPDYAASEGHPPLVLRLVVAQGPRHPVFLVTSVLDDRVLTDQQVIQTYALRWGVELFYRHFKQTFDRWKLRSHRGENAELEGTWSLLGLWSVVLHAEVELSYDSVPASAIRVAKVLRVYRGVMRDHRSVAAPGQSLWERLSTAVVDSYRRRNKTSRDYPRKKQSKPIGAPEVRAATAVEVELAQEVKMNMQNG